ncbi:MAG: nucleoside hydrolase, partial [Nitrospirales bacterium]
ELHTATQVHGSDGLGDLGLRGNGEAWWRPELDVPPDLPSALTVWQQGLRQYPDSLTLITLGPLTNLAQALQEAPALPSTFRRIICMGGAVAAPGNVTPVAEFNVFVDPHAARRVFEAGLPLTLVPLDVTMRTTLSREAIQSLTAEARSPVLRFLREATEPVILFTEQVQGRSVLELHDPLAVGVAIDPTLVTLHPLFVTVETEGRVTRGMTVADRRGLRPPYKSPANAEVALSVDIPRFLTLFQERLCRS